MPRSSKADKILLGTLLPLFLVVFGLHVREGIRTGIAQAPFFAVPSDDDRGYPRVGGPRLEHGIDRSGLEVGDLLIRAGETDLKGFGYFGFDAVVVEEAGLAMRTPLVYESDGVQHETELALLPYPRPFMRIPFLLSMAAVGTIILLRVPGQRSSRLVFTATLTYAICELHFFGGPRWQSYASLVLFNFGGGIAMWSLLRWIIEFPLEVPRSARLSPKLAWLGGLFVLARLNYLFGGPIQTDLVPFFVLASDGIVILTLIGILTWNTAHATAIGRRRSKWILLGAYATAIPMLIGLLPAFFEADGFDHFETLPYVMLLGAAFPLSLLVAIIGFDLYDIDRILSSTAAYSLAVAAAFAAVVGVAPSIASSVSQTTGLGERETTWLLAGGMLIVGSPLGRLLRSRIDRLVFPERRRRETGFQQLFVDLAQCDDASELLRLLVDRVSALVRPEFAFVLVRKNESFVPRRATTDYAGLTLPARGRLALELETQPRPLEIASTALTRLDAEETSLLQAHAVEVIVPIRQGKDLTALICIGARRSGDIFTSTDLTLLGAAAEKAASELDRFQEASTLEFERERSAELTELKEAAEQANLAKSRFLAAASHDLRQPLHALGLFVNRLDRHVSGEDGAALVENVRTSTDSLSEMFTTVLDLSRLDAGAVVPERAIIDLDREFAQLESSFGVLAREKNLAFELASNGEQVFSDPQMLRRILQNLLTNAIRYSDHGSVKIAARRVGEHVEITVRDTGRGIPADKREEIFHEFVQLDGESEERVGIGLGLSIVDRLVKMLGHQIELESEVGSGSCFTLRVPAVTSQAPHAAPPLAGGGTGLEGASIVVIDDDLAILEGTRDMLHGWGCSVVVASNIDDALKGIEWRGPPDVILADYRLGHGENGIRAIERIRAAVGRRVPAGIITGETTPELITEFATRGLVHVSKPVLPITLRALLMELFRPT
jgi:signal transduction histidine kinase